MQSRRSEIRMSDAEVERLMDEERVVTVATMMPNGRPHLMPLWYVHEGTTVAAWTFGKSQKVKNLERDPHATLQIEAGDQYADLRGTMLECDVTIEGAARRPSAWGSASAPRAFSRGTTASWAVVTDRATASRPRLYRRWSPRSARFTALTHCPWFLNPWG